MSEVGQNGLWSPGRSNARNRVQLVITAYEMGLVILPR
jgi:hypothetical protein